MKKLSATRRDFVKLAATAMAGSSLAGTASASETAGQPEKLLVKIAGYHYDRTRAISDGVLGIEGADVTFTY